MGKLSHLKKKKKDTFWRSIFFFSKQKSIVLTKLEVYSISISVSTAPHYLELMPISNVLPNTDSKNLKTQECFLMFKLYLTHHFLTRFCLVGKHTFEPNYLLNNSAIFVCVCSCVFMHECSCVCTCLCETCHAGMLAPRCFSGEWRI